METSFKQTTSNKVERYRLFLPQFELLISDEKEEISVLANTAAALREAFGFFWVGFYLVKDNQLILGPFQGSTACYRIHKGKGVCGTSLGHTLDKRRARYGTEGKEVIACIGPGISLSAFEVGDEVYEAFRKNGFQMDYISEWKPATHKYHIDLWAANRLQLLDFGVPSAQVETANICTFTQYEEFFSARRMGIKSGRILSGIMLTHSNGLH